MYLNDEEDYKVVFDKMYSQKPELNNLICNWIESTDQRNFQISPLEFNKRFILLSKVRLFIILS